MQTKLTLRIDKDIIEEVKQLAKRNNTSVSKMVENYFYHISGKGDTSYLIEPSPIDELTGIVHDAGSDEEIMKEYYKNKVRKHLKTK